MEEGEEDSWNAPTWIYPALILGCAATIVFKSSRSPRFSLAFIAFQRSFLCVFFLAQAAYSFQNLYTEALYKSYGLQREDMSVLLLVGHAAALTFGTLIALSADSIGRKKICKIYALFILLETIFKQFGQIHTLYLARICNGVASSILYCVFETWMISEHEKAGFRQEWLGDTFWIVTFGGYLVSLGTSAGSNFLITGLAFGLRAPSLIASLTAIACGLLISSTWSENTGDKHIVYAFRDRRVVLLGLVQACFDLSLSVFWLLWIPTIVADGRGIHGGSIYAIFMGCGMLGSCIASLLTSPHILLPFVLAIAGFCFIVPAYDYQEIPVLVGSFSVFHICMGIAAPLLAHLRSLYVPNGCRAGVYAIYHGLSKVVLMVVLNQGARLRSMDNSTILYICGLATVIAGILNARWKPSSVLLADSKIINE